MQPTRRPAGRRSNGIKEADRPSQTVPPPPPHTPPPQHARRFHDSEKRSRLRRLDASTFATGRKERYYTKIFTRDSKQCAASQQHPILWILRLVIRSAKIPFESLPRQPILRKICKMTFIQHFAWDSNIAIPLSM